MRTKPSLSLGILPYMDTPSELNEVNLTHIEQTSSRWSSVYRNLRRQVLVLFIILFLVLIAWVLYHNGEVIYQRGLK